MTQAAKVQEPTMEEILASIRRIIADEEAAKPQRMELAHSESAAAASSSELPQPGVAESVLQFDADAGAQVAGHPSEGSTEIGSENTEPTATAAMLEDFTAAEVETDFPEPNEHSNDDFEASAAPTSLAPAPAAHVGQFDPVAPLLSPEASAAVNSAFGTLAHTVLVQNATTLEDLVREMLRPLLKTWLDDNLPGLVERLVRMEIERVSRGRA